MMAAYPPAQHVPTREAVLRELLKDVFERVRYHQALRDDTLDELNWQKDDAAADALIDVASHIEDELLKMGAKISKMEAS